MNRILLISIVFIMSCSELTNNHEDTNASKAQGVNEAESNQITKAVTGQDEDNTASITSRNNQSGTNEREELSDLDLSKALPLNVSVDFPDTPNHTGLKFHLNDGKLFLVSIYVSIQIYDANNNVIASGYGKEKADTASENLRFLDSYDVQNFVVSDNRYPSSIEAASHWHSAESLYVLYFIDENGDGFVFQTKIDW